jgi:hypothetical protein
MQVQLLLGCYSPEGISNHLLFFSCMKKPEERERRDLLLLLLLTHLAKVKSRNSGCHFFLSRPIRERRISLALKVQL